MRFLTADKIFNGRQFLPQNTVLALDESGVLKELVTAGEVEQGSVERLQGLLTPGFVNSHCHLELSHLKGFVPKYTGLPEFAKQVIINRNKVSPEEIAERMEIADLEMWDNGIVAVGDISNGADSFAQKRASKIFYHTFVELIGLNPENAEFIFDKGQLLLAELESLGLQGNLAPHAPYSTSLKLMERIAAYDSLKQTTFSIHNQESEAETRFFMKRENGFTELYKFLGLDISGLRIPKKNSSLQYYAVALPDTPALLVHNTVTNKEDLEAVRSKKVFWCFCPSANLYIENRLPDFELFKGLKDRICIGTDSLASNDSLDVIKEANLILKHPHAFSLEIVLSAITFNAATALGLGSRFGQLHAGRNAGLNLLDDRDGQLQFIKKIV